MLATTPPSIMCDSRSLSTVLFFCQGAGYKSTNWPRKCFNAYNQWQLQWYESRARYLDPSSDGPAMLKLAAFTDFDVAAPTDYVVVSIQDEYFLNYNRAKKFNIDTEEKRNMVTVTEPADAGTNCLVGLMAGQRYEIKTSDGSNLFIEVCEMVLGSGSSPDIAIVSIGIDVSLCDAPSISITQDTPGLGPSLAPPAAQPQSTVIVSLVDETPVPTMRSGTQLAAPAKRPSNDISDEFSGGAVDETPAKRPTSVPAMPSTPNVPSIQPFTMVTLTPTRSSSIDTASPSVTPTVAKTNEKTLSPSTTSPTPDSLHNPTSPPTIRSGQADPTSSPNNALLTSEQPSWLPSTLEPSRHSIQDDSPVLPTSAGQYHEISETSTFNFDLLFSDAKAARLSIQTSVERPMQSNEAGHDGSSVDTSLDTMVPVATLEFSDETPAVLIIPFDSESRYQSAAYSYGSGVWIIAVMAAGNCVL
jgi:hypothetical protein